MLRAILVDDEIPNLLLLKRTIEKSGQLEIVGQYTNPREALESINKIKTDIAFLDIEMPGMNGLELAENIQSLDEEIAVVFVTAYSQYAIDAFKVNALDYLLKPLDEKEINRVMLKITERYSRNSDRTIALSSEFTRLDSAKILCMGRFEVYGKADQKVQFMTAKIEELFAYLIIHQNGPIDKWKLCDLLWPELPPKKAATNLHTSVYRLKKTIYNEKVPIEIKSNSYGYFAEYGQTFIDYFKFQDIVSDFFKKSNHINSKSDVNLLIEAVNLYKGQLFADKNYIWAEGYGADIEQSYIKILYLLCDYYGKSEQIQEEKDYLEKLLKQFPYEERALIKIMDIYKVQKNKISLVKQYNRHVKYLNEEIGCNSSFEVQKKYKEIVKNL